MGFSLFLGSASFPNQNGAVSRTVAPAPTVLAGYSVTLTAYNAVPAQTDSNPFETASGAYSNPEIIAARSADLADELPFGTIIAIDGPSGSTDTCGYRAVAPLIGYRVIEDSMNPRYTHRIDVLFDTKDNFVRTDGTEENAANVLGICKKVAIRVVGHVGFSRIPKTQRELASLVEKGSQLALK